MLAYYYETLVCETCMIEYINLILVVVVIEGNIFRVKSKYEMIIKKNKFGKLKIII